MGRLLVFGFKIRDTRPESKLLSFLANYYKFHTKSSEISLRFVKICSKSGEISSLSDKIEARSVIFVQSRQSRLDFGPGDKTWGQPETDKTQTKKSDQINRVNFESNFHPPKSFVSSPGWAQTRPDLTRGQPYQWLSNLHHHHLFFLSSSSFFLSFLFFFFFFGWITSSSSK